MFKKSNTPGDNTPKQDTQETKDNTYKTASAVADTPQTAEKASADKAAPSANDSKKS